MNHVRQPQPLFGAANSWRASNSDLLPSEESFRYYWRAQRAELVGSGAVVLLRGQFQVVESNMLRATVLAIAARDAQAAVADIDSAAA